MLRPVLDAKQHLAHHREVAAAIAITADGKTAQVPNYDDGTVTPIDLAAGAAGAAERPSALAAARPES